MQSLCCYGFISRLLADRYRASAPADKARSARQIVNVVECDTSGPERTGLSKRSADFAIRISSESEAEMSEARWNPNAIADGMIVRNVTRPTMVYRVSGDPVRGRSTFVALSPNERTVLNGSARNYRPETAMEQKVRGEVPDTALALVPIDPDEAEPIPVSPETADIEESDHLVEPEESADTVPVPVPAIAELCEQMGAVVESIADGSCSLREAAAIVLAAARLNEAVLREHVLDD